MGDENEIVESVEIQSDTEESATADDVGLGPAGELLEESSDVLELLPEDPVEDIVESPSAGPEISDSLSPDRVEEIVEAVLSSDRVTGLLDSFEYTLQSVSDAVAAVSERERGGEEETQEPIVVISADDLLDRLEARQAETAQAAQASVKSAPMNTQTMAAASPSLTKGGEILVPGEGELSPVEMIAQLVQLIYEHFQEDDIDMLTSIKGTVEEIQKSVTPHPLMDTPFEEYTVTEGLLLVAVLWFVVFSPCIRMIKGGFSWLLQ